MINYDMYKKSNWILVALILDNLELANIEKYFLSNMYANIKYVEMIRQLRLEKQESMRNRKYVQIEIPLIHLIKRLTN